MGLKLHLADRRYGLVAVALEMAFAPRETRDLTTDSGFPPQILNLHRAYLG
jgi:hypothetical protein